MLVLRSAVLAGGNLSSSMPALARRSDSLSSSTTTTAREVSSASAKGRPAGFKFLRANNNSWRSAELLLVGGPCSHAGPRALLLPAALAGLLAGPMHGGGARVVACGNLLSAARRAGARCASVRRTMP